MLQNFFITFFLLEKKSIKDFKFWKLFGKISTLILNAGNFSDNHDQEFLCF